MLKAVRYLSVLKIRGGGRGMRMQILLNCLDYAVSGNMWKGYYCGFFILFVEILNNTALVLPPVIGRIKKNNYVRCFLIYRTPRGGCDPLPKISDSIF